MTPQDLAALVPADAFAGDVALRAPGLLREFNQAGVLAAADVHVALVLGRLARIADPELLLAAALAVRAPRLGHVFVDLRTASQTVAVEDEAGEDLLALPWPEPEAWLDALRAARGLLACGEDEDTEVRPLRLIGSRLYLDRYWREERQLAAGLAGLALAPSRTVEIDRLRAALARLFPARDDQLQRCAAACAVLRGLSVVAGGPGTGKTTTVARLAALLAELAAGAGQPPPLIALCAPTGKAAARLQEAVHAEASQLTVDEEVRAQLLDLRASTIHRLLGWRPGSHSRFRHDSSNRLPHDIVIVDETSMVSLSLMARLLEAVRADAGVVLVGDPDQLTAIEAGAVLRDIVGPASDGLQMSEEMRRVLRRVADAELPGGPVASTPCFGDGIIALRRGHRFGAAIGSLADAIRRGDPEGMLAAAHDAPEEITWIQIDAGDEEFAADEVMRRLEPLREACTDAGRSVVEAALAGDRAAALESLGAFRLLCAHRRGPYGVAIWTGQMERWLSEAIEGFRPEERDYVGRPLLITENDYELRLYNGDTGVVVSTGPGSLGAAFLRDGQLVTFAPSRLGSAQTLYAMTIHKSQGSQFDVAAVLLPDPSSRILTRELLYTAVTRARRRLILIGSEASVRAAVVRPVARATGLRERLWAASLPSTSSFPT